MDSERPGAARESAAGAAACRCVPTHHGVPVDTATLNRAAEERLKGRPARAGEVDCLIVPGYTPRFGWRSHELHPRAADSCARAAADLAAGVADVVIASGGAVHGPANEALLMRGALLAEGVPEDRILVEPCARHTTTNLRNAARIMFAHELQTAWIVAPDTHPKNPVEWLRRFSRQSYFVGHPYISLFHLRCRLTLGYRVGRLAWVKLHHVHFVPSRDCLRESFLLTREGDA